MSAESERIMIIRVKHYVQKSKLTGNTYDRGYDVWYKSGLVKTYNKHTVPQTVLSFIEKHAAESGELKEYEFMDAINRVYQYHLQVETYK